MTKRARARELFGLAITLRVALVATAVVGLIVTTAVSDLLWRRSVALEAQTDLLRMATVMAAQTARDVADEGATRALVRLRRTLATPTSGMGFSTVVLTPQSTVLAATTGAPIGEGEAWPVGPIRHESPKGELDVGGNRYLVAYIHISGTEWVLASIEPVADVLPDVSFSHWLVLLFFVLLLGTVGVFLHNTEVRSRVAEQAMESERMARGLVDLMDSVGVAALVNVETGELLKTNEEFARAVGQQRAGALEGRQWREFTDDYIAARYESLFSQALFHGVARGAEIPQPDDRGGMGYFDVLVKRVWPGRPEVFVIATNVTERRLMQEEIAKRAQELERRGRRLEEQLARTVAAAARYRNLITNAPDPIIVADGRTHRILEANPQAEQQLGMTYDQLRGAPLSVIDASRGLRIEDLLEQAAQEGVVRNADLVVPTAPGRQPSYIEATIAHLSAGEEELFHIILRDVTAERLIRSQVEEAYQRMAAQARRLEDVNEQLRRATEAKSYFLATVSHELRAPLNSIVGFTELLLDETYGELNDRQKEFLGDVQTSSGHLLKLINDVLELARMEAGRITLRPAPVGVEGLFKDVFTLTRGAAKDRRQRVLFSQEHEDMVVMADEHRTKQVLINLVTNALKYSPPDSTVRVEAHVEGEEVIFSVADEGQGIAPEDQDRIFREFERVERGRQSAATGFGLGLPLSKYLVELHGGRIWVDSALGAGSTFYFTLPRFEIVVEGEEAEEPLAGDSGDETSAQTRSEGPTEDRAQGSGEGEA